MDDKEQFEIRLITEAEHHFNDLCFKIRALASTWLLATFGGIGFLSTNTLHIEVPLNGLITLLCIASAIGITVLWVIDLLIYQPFLNCWFQCRTKLGHESQMTRMVYECMSASQPHRRATNFIKIYYHVT